MNKIPFYILCCILATACSEAAKETSVQQKEDASNQQKEESGVPKIEVHPEMSEVRPSDQRIHLNWSSSENATHYVLLWRTTGTDSVAADSGEINVSSDTSYVHMNLINDVSYYYIITAYEESELIHESQEVSAIPNPIPNEPVVSILVGDGENVLTWEQIDSVGYNIYWSDQAGISKESVKIAADLQSGIYHHSTPNYTSNFYIVTASNYIGESDYNAVLEGIPFVQAKQVSASNSWSCMLRIDSSIWCWGSGISNGIGIQESSRANDWSFLSDRGNCAIKDNGAIYCTSARSMSYKLIDNSRRYKFVSGMIGHACAISIDKQLFCWGNNSYGNLGADMGSTGNSDVLIRESLFANDWYTVSVGASHTCGLRNVENQIGKSLWCWGGNHYNQFGVSKETITVASTPYLVDATASWLDISTGLEFSCGIKTDGNVYCWGRNSNGNLGLPSTGPISAYSELQLINLGEPVSSVKVYSYRVCAMTVSQKLYCWGEYTKNDAGNYKIAHSQAPLLVGSDPLMKWKSIISGKNHSCGIRPNNQSYCWGKNEFGQLGNGEIGAKSTPTLVTNNSGNLEFSKFSLGTNFTCGSQGGLNSLYCWGFNLYRQLGFDDNIHRSYAGYVNYKNIKSLSAANNYSCAIITNGQGSDLKCWGKYNYLDGSSSDWDSVYTSLNYRCAIKNSGQLYCWGENYLHQLGFNLETASEVDIPTQVNADTNWIKLSLQKDFACALKYRDISGNVIVCWGSNRYYQLANSEIIGSTAEHQVISASSTQVDEDWIDVGTYGAGACGLKSNYKLYCWGFWNKKIHNPTLFYSDETWHKIAFSNSEFCGVKQDRSLWCSSFTDFYQDGIEHPPLVQENSLSNDWEDIEAGDSHICAKKQNNKLYCWGRNMYGEIGDGSAWKNIPQVVQVENTN